MKMFTFKGLGILLAVVLTFAVAGCGGPAPEPNDTAAPGVDTPEETAPMAAPVEPAPAAPAEPAPAEPAPAATGPESAAPASGDAMSAAPAADAAAPAAGAALTAESLTGTKWNAGGMAFSFEKDGVLKVNDTMPGTWSIDGTTLTVGAIGQEFKASIEGDKIIYEGTPLEKVN
ncbi:MAG: hypothetical protein IT365_13310 [Candidatus Hydrogenedentes bacterium]|nr:hypothetical protein [Candidatus Hydrogenedentota bacterium]